MSKTTIRKRILGKLKQLSIEEREVWSRLATDRLCAMPFYQEATVLATYLSLSHEYDTSYLIERAIADGKTIVVPKTYSQGRMIFVEYKADDLEETKFGTLEPRSDLEIPAWPPFPVKSRYGLQERVATQHFPIPPMTPWWQPATL